MTLGSKVAEQAAEATQIDTSGLARQGWDFCIKIVEPTEQMGIPAQIRQAAHAGKIRLKIGKQTMGSGAKVSVRSREGLETGVKQLLEFAAC